MKTRTKTRTIPKTPFFAAFSVGAVLFSAHAGGGFATGNQANTYYVGLGWAGIVSAIVAMLLLTLGYAHTTLYELMSAHGLKMLYTVVYGVSLGIFLVAGYMVWKTIARLREQEQAADRSQKKNRQSNVEL